MCTTNLASYSLSRWKFWQLTLKWFSGARAQDKNKQYYFCFHFFLFWCNYEIQGKSITWLVNSALNCTWKPISHSSLRDSCEIGFRGQFNSEFARQVMNFPIKYTLYEEKSGKTFLYLFLVICCLKLLTTRTWNSVDGRLRGEGEYMDRSPEGRGVRRVLDETRFAFHDLSASITF